MSIINIILIIIFAIELFLLLYFIKLIPKRENKILLLTFVILLIISIIIYVIEIDIFNNIISKKNTMLLAVDFIIIIILKMSFNYYLIEKKYNKAIEYVSEYERIIDDQGKKNHEYNNQLMVIKGYINDKNKLEEYLDTIISDHKTGQNYEIRQLSNFPNGGLKEMLYYKISKIKDNNIKYYLYISKEAAKYLEKLNTKTYNEITKVFGVIIDNAIEAALDSKEKEVSIDFSIDDYVVITISNSYNKKINLNKIGKNKYTSKGKGHGFGLRIVKDIIKRNKKLELITDYDDKYFIQTFLIDIK